MKIAATQDRSIAPGATSVYPVNGCSLPSSGGVSHLCKFAGTETDRRRCKVVLKRVAKSNQKRVSGSEG